MSFRRPQAEVLSARLAEAPRLIQVVAGPRQVGKSSMVRAVMGDRPVGSYLSVDAERRTQSADPGTDLPTDLAADQHASDNWLHSQWLRANRMATEWLASRHPMAERLPFVLVIDEIQLLPQWSSVIKGLWDHARAEGQRLHLVLLGSAPLLVQQGLNEGLTGRYEVIPLLHWSFEEMSECFGTTLEQYIYFGSYPGAAPLVADEARWRSHTRMAMVEPSIERDVLAMTRVDAPASLRRLFELGCEYSAQVLALDRIRRTMQGSHVLTMAHHLTLLDHAGLLTGLYKYAAQTIRQRQSPPKFQVLNNALFSVHGTHRFAEARADRSRWGRLVESAVGAHLLNTSDADTRIHYWRDAGFEVDFVVEHRGAIAAIEVKSQGVSERPRGLDEFCRRHPGARRWIVGGAALSLEEFFTRRAMDWVA